MEEKKDEKLNALFKDYLSEEEAPSKNVTQKAVEYMRTAEQEEVPVSVAATQNSTSSEGKGGRKRYYFIAAAGFLLLLCAALAYAFISKNNLSDFSSAESLTAVSDSQLSETEASIPQGATEWNGVLRFVPYEAVKEYKKYYLTENVADYSAGEPIIYYVEYSMDGQSIALYAEANGICLEELAFYKEYGQKTVYSGVTFWYGINDETKTSYAYFKSDSFGYNLKLFSADKATLEKILSEIAKNI